VKINKKNLKTLFTLLIPLIITIFLTLFLQNTIINNPELLQKWLRSFGVLSIFIYIIVQSITIIIAPIGGLSAALAIIAIFGPLWGNIIIYFVTLPLYVINFLLARKFGRPFVKRIIGEKGLATADKYTQKLNISVLIFLKIFMGGYFDYISYAAGFTKIDLKSFIIVNLLGAIPGTILTYFIFKYAPNFSTAVVLMLVIPFILGIIYVPLHKKLKKYLKKENPLSREI